MQNEEHHKLAGGVSSVDPHVEISSHDKDYSNVGLHETALFRVFMFWTKVEERSSDRSVLLF